MKDVVSQLEFARIANIMPTTLRVNIRILLKMALENGYTLKKDVAEKMNKGILRWKK